MLRLLAADGIVAMSEPGEGHGVAATSLTESANTGVLENELVIEDVATLAEAVGFTAANVLATWGYSLYSSPYYRLWWRFFFRPRIPLTIAA